MAALAMGLRKPLASEEVRTIVKEDTRIPHIVEAEKSAENEMYCTGCAKVFAPEPYIVHSMSCAAKEGKGNTTRRHNAMRDAAIEQCRNGQLGTEKEMFLQNPADSSHTGRMDMVVGQWAVDFTITTKPNARQMAKHHTYKNLLPPSLTLKVIAISPTGRVHDDSYHIARSLAKRASMTFEEFWGPVLAEVKRGTAQAINRARDEVITAHNQRRAREASTQPTAPAGMQSPHGLDKLAHESDSESDDHSDADAAPTAAATAAAATAPAPAAAAVATPAPAPHTPHAASSSVFAQAGSASTATPSAVKATATPTSAQ